MTTIGLSCGGSRLVQLSREDEWKHASKLDKITGANSRRASQFESRGLRRCTLVVERHGRYHGCRSVLAFTPPIAATGAGIRVLRLHYGKAAEDQNTAALIVLPKLFTGGEE
jgi:hypothetical protein